MLGTLELAKSATERAEASERTQVTLQKVASAARIPALDPEQVNSTLQILADRALIKPEGIEKIASALIADPNNVLKFMEDMFTLSAGSHDEGTGIPKNASVNDVPGNQVDPDGWVDVITGRA